MEKPKALVLTGYGINCDFETQFALASNGAIAKRVHINDLISGKEKLEDFQIFGLPGGFSYGDDISAGKVLANKIRTNLKEQIQQFIKDGKLVFGFCNGFQIMAKAGLLPYPSNSLEQTVTLTNNDSNRYEDRWVFLKSQGSNCVFTKGIDLLYLPVAHGEGKFYAGEKALKELETQKQIVFKYADSEGNPASNAFPLNPNGSLQDIAGICDKTGRIFGMMPHPERCLSVFNKPDWGFLKEKALRNGSRLEAKGEGNLIFKNAVEFVKENF